MASEGEQVCVEVSDTGKGIEPEHQGKIFEPFFTTKGVGVGSGLGLSICKNIVTGFGGEIGFTSEIGKGTRFLVKLPRLPSDWDKSNHAAAEQKPIPSEARGRVLVVDDEPGIRAAVARILGRENDVVTAASGKDGQTLLENDRRFDLIFCDLMMPKMSGIELHACRGSWVDCRSGCARPADSSQGRRVHVRAARWRAWVRRGWQRGRQRLRAGCQRGLSRAGPGSLSLSKL